MSQTSHRALIPGSLVRLSELASVTLSRANATKNNFNEYILYLSRWAQN